MFKQKLLKIGGSLAITFPNKEAEFEGLKEGDWVEVRFKKIQKIKEVDKNG